VDVSGLHLGESRMGDCGLYIDNYSTPFADVEGVTHWMLPEPPARGIGAREGQDPQGLEAKPAEPGRR
jgi:hypothetical protein